MMLGRLKVGARRESLWVFLFKYLKFCHLHWYQDESGRKSEELHCEFLESNTIRWSWLLSLNSSPVEMPLPIFTAINLNSILIIQLAREVIYTLLLFYLRFTNIQIRGWKEWERETIDDDGFNGKFCDDLIFLFPFQFRILPSIERNPSVSVSSLLNLCALVCTRLSCRSNKIQAYQRDFFCERAHKFLDQIASFLLFCKKDARWYYFSILFIFFGIRNRCSKFDVWLECFFSATLACIMSSNKKKPWR